MLQIDDLKAFDVQELAVKLELTPQSVRAYIKAGKLKGCKVGTKLYVTEQALKDYLLGK